MKPFKNKAEARKHFGLSVDPIQRSITVSKNVDGVYFTKENGLVGVYKNNRKVASFYPEDFDKFFKTLK